MLNILGAHHHGEQLALEFSGYKACRRLLWALTATLALVTFAVWFGCQVYVQCSVPVSPAHYQPAQ
jgi:hypothetical protein